VCASEDGLIDLQFATLRPLRVILRVVPNVSEWVSGFSRRFSRPYSLLPLLALHLGVHVDHVLSHWVEVHGANGSDLLLHRAIIQPNVDSSFKSVYLNPYIARL
jgi:hypothetical protein